MLGTLGWPSNGTVSECHDLITSFTGVLVENVPDVYLLSVHSVTNTSRLNRLIDFLLVAARRVSHQAHKAPPSRTFRSILHGRNVRQVLVPLEFCIVWAGP